MSVLGICGGNGVILYPLKKHLIANIEPRGLFKTPGDKQWEINFKGIPLINDTKAEVCWSKYLKLKLPNPNIIIGAPDCGDSSVLSYSRRKVLGNPKVNNSLQLYLQGVQRFKPGIFVMENLPKLLETYSKDNFREMFPGYRLIFHSKSVSCWGNSQVSRVRLVLIGVREDQPVPLYRLLKDTYHVVPLKTTGELLEGLKRGINGHISESEDEVITLYAGFKMSVYEIKREWQTTREGKKRWEVTDRRFTTAPGVYRNLGDFPPATARKANRQFNPDGEMMSPRELARIQGVPDSFKLVFEESRLNYWINKGRVTVTKTPPMEIPIWFKKQLKKANMWP